MQRATTPSASSTPSLIVRLRTVGTISLASIAVAGLFVYSLRATTNSSSAASNVSCASRLIIVDTSSETRSPELALLTQEVVQYAAQSAVICGTSLSAYGVDGGGQVTPIITTDDLANYTPIGPNVQIRSTRFSAAEQAALDRLVTSQLRASYHSGDPSVTSLAALYQLGTEQSTSRTDVVMLSTGVNHDTVVDLNQPLASGQGAILARRISIPKIAALNLTIVGLAQVDSALPPPSAEWPSQVLSFNLALCRASHAAHCRLFEMASPTQVLNPRKES